VQSYLNLFLLIYSIITCAFFFVLNKKLIQINKYNKCNQVHILRTCLSTWWRPRFVRFHATSCLVNNKRVLLFTGSHMLLRLKRIKRGSSYELLPAWPKSNSCYCSVNSGACLQCSLNSFFFFENSGGMPPLFSE